MISVDATLDIETGSGFHRVRLSSYLVPAAVDSAEAYANEWIKGLRTAVVDGSPFRDKFTVRGDSLWWFAETCLHRSRAIVSVFQTVVALESLISKESPRLVRFLDGDQIVARVAELVVKHHGIVFRPPLMSRLSLWRMRVAYKSRALTDVVMVWILSRCRLLSSEPWNSVSKPIAVFVYSAFWKSNIADETYLGPILSELQKLAAPQKLVVVGIGPRVKPTRRKWKDKVSEFLDPRGRSFSYTPIGMFWSRCKNPVWTSIWQKRKAMRQAMLSSATLSDASVIRGFDLRSVLADEWGKLADYQFPWAARAMDLAGAVIDTVEPSLIVTYAEAGDWGRALVLEARRRRIPIVGVQHGFIHRHWLYYLHEPDEIRQSEANPADRGFPLPDMTLIFDEFARQHLIHAGHFPPQAVAVTGNSRLESFVEAAQKLSTDDVERIREAVGVRPGQHLVVFASKYIAEFDGVIRELVNAVREMSDVHLVMKCHPADAVEPYERLAEGLSNVSVTDASTSLGSLTAAARLLVTVNSTAAIEAMVLGTPALALSLPNFLSPFIEAGAMAGTYRVEEIAPVLRDLIEDDECRERLTVGRRDFLSRYGMNSGSGSARRAAEKIIELARHSSMAARN